MWISVTHASCPLSTGSCLHLGGIPQLNHTKITPHAQYGSVMNLMLTTHSTVTLSVVDAIQEGLFVIHRILIRVEVRIGHQVKFRITGIRILRLRVRISRAKKATWFFYHHYIDRFRDGAVNIY